MAPTLFDKLIALLALAFAVWSITTFAQSLSSGQSPNYWLPPLAGLALWLIYWIFSPEKKDDKTEVEQPAPAPRIPELPRKKDSGSMYVDDARIVDKINHAIDLAEQKNWRECERKLQGVESDIEDWEPYDTSDSYYEMIWGGAISQIRSYIEFNSSTPSTERSKQSSAQE